MRYQFSTEPLTLQEWIDFYAFTKGDPNALLRLLLARITTEGITEFELLNMGGFSLQAAIEDLNQSIVEAGAWKSLIERHGLQ